MTSPQKLTCALLSWQQVFFSPSESVISCFRNCGAFLRITTKARSLVNAEVEPIDCARIEPLSYKLAFRLARQAVGSQGGDPQQDVIDVNKAMSRPEMVEALNLEVRLNETTFLGM